MPVRLRVRGTDGNRHHRHATARTILAGIESVGAQAMRDHGLRLEVLPPHATGVQAVGSTARAWNQAAVEVEVRSWPATAMSACAKSGGNVFPRLAARRRIPRQAVELK